MQRLKEFQEGMSSDEIEVKLKYVRQVVEVANEIGKDETISSLIPFLNDWCPDNDDEALTKLANEIYKLNTVFDATEMKYVLPILKHLATTEEVVVRDAAVESINKIVDDMPPAVVRSELVVLISDLFHDEWFTPRVSSCYLIAKAYAKIVILGESEDVSEPLKTLRDCFFGLCKDDTPMVRRAAAKNMFAVFAACGDECVSGFVGQFEEFFNADDETTKLSLMVFIKDLLLRVKDEADRKVMLSIFQSCLEARSYKIREASVLEIGEVAKILGSDCFLELLMTPYLALLKDSYVDVKNNAIKQMTPLAKILPREVFEQQLYPHVSNLLTDKAAVIETVAGVIVDLGTVYPDLVEASYTTLLNNLTPQVRLLLLQRLDEIHLNEEINRCLVLESSLEGPFWRIREEIARHMSHLLIATKDTPQQDAMSEIYLRLFVDGVSKVRETCRTALGQILQDLGADYVFTKIIPAIEKKYNETNNYLLIFNFLYAYQVVIRAIPSDARVENMYTTLVKELNNAVPNIRFVSCRILADLADVLPENVKTSAIAKMKELEADDDRDVRYFAALGLKKFN